MGDSIIPSKNRKLQGKVAIVTGGASGIGEATARSFAAHGVRAVVIADVQDDKGHKVAASIGADRSTYIRCDVSDEDQVRSLIESTVQIYGSLDVVFSNAGVASASEQKVLDLDVAGYERLFAVNAKGMALLVKHAARAMVARGVKGSIVCTASVLASVGTTGLTDYTMSKHAVLGLVRSASIQLGPKGIRVNAVSPGPVKTPLMRKSMGGDGDVVGSVEEEEKLDSVVGSTMILKTGKVTSAEGVAEAVAFLASDEAEFITGHNLPVDGGYINPV